MSTAVLEIPRQHPIITDDIERMARTAGIRVEIINGLPVWEASPVIRHQKLSDLIRASIRSAVQDSGCQCIHYADIYILFPEGSIKRPDICLFCHEPAQQDTMCETIPEAVIEILSKNYEKKDTEISLPFYLSQGVRDIVLLDPLTSCVSHYQDATLALHQSPAELIFACGCRVTV